MSRLSQNGSNHYLVLIEYVCLYDFHPAQTSYQINPKRYPKRVPTLHIPGHQKSIFGIFPVARSFSEVWDFKMGTIIFKTLLQQLVQKLNTFWRSFGADLRPHMDPKMNLRTGPKMEPHMIKNCSTCEGSWRKVL